MRKLLVALSLAGMLTLSVGCKSNSSNKELDEMKLQVEELQKQNDDQGRQLATMKGQRDEALRRMNEMDRVPAEQPQGPAKANGFDQAAEEAGLQTGRTAEGFQAIRIGDDVLFSPGRAEVHKGGEATLKKVADLIKKQHAGHTIRVDGHTDNDPIRKSAKLFQDNWHLSAMRALNVMRVLIQQGVPQEKIYVAAFGETRPLDANDSKAHKAKNRRVDVVVVD